MHLNSKEGGEAEGVCIGEFGGVDGITAILGVEEWRREPLPALSQLWGSYTAAEMPRSFSNHTSPRDVLMVVVDSRMFVKDSARLSLRGVQGVATGVDFKWPVLLQVGAGAELRLGVTRVSSSEGCRMRQVVKVKVELVCDMHFPGWGARSERKENKHSSNPS